MCSLHKNSFKTPLLSLDTRIFDIKDHLVSRKKQAPLSTTIGNGELMHECLPKHSLAWDQQKRNKKRHRRRRYEENSEYVERSPAGTKKIIARAHHHPVVATPGSSG